MVTPYFTAARLRLYQAWSQWTQKNQMNKQPLFWSAKEKEKTGGTTAWETEDMHRCNAATKRGKEKKKEKEKRRQNKVKNK